MINNSIIIMIIIIIIIIIILSGLSISLVMSPRLVVTNREHFSKKSYALYSF